VDVPLQEAPNEAFSREVIRVIGGVEFLAGDSKVDVEQRLKRLQAEGVYVSVRRVWDDLEADFPGCDTDIYYFTDGILDGWWPSYCY